MPPAVGHFLVSQVEIRREKLEGRWRRLNKEDGGDPVPSQHPSPSAMAGTGQLHLPPSPPSALSQQAVTATGKREGRRDGGKETVPCWGGRTPDAASTAPVS